MKNLYLQFEKQTVSSSLFAEGRLIIIAAGETCGYYYNLHINSEGVECQY